MKKSILIFLVIFLIISYCVSFIPKNKSYKSFETQFINARYTADDISNLTISKNGTTLSIFKKENFWEGKLYEKNKEFIFPCDTKIVENELNKLRKTVKMYKISDSLSNLSDYSLNPLDRTEISYLTNDGKSSHFICGGKDFSRLNTFILLEGKKSVYKAEYDFSALKSLSVRSWCDPYIIPKSLMPEKLTLKNVKLENQDKLYELRHGAVTTFPENYKCFKTVNLIFEKNFQAKLDFYKTETDYIVNYYSEQINFFYHISEWTYDALTELLEK